MNTTYHQCSLYFTLVVINNRRRVRRAPRHAPSLGAVLPEHLPRAIVPGAMTQYSGVRPRESSALMSARSAMRTPPVKPFRAYSCRRRFLSSSGISGIRGSCCLENLDCLGVLCPLHGCVARLISFVHVAALGDSYRHQVPLARRNCAKD